MAAKKPSAKVKPPARKKAPAAAPKKKTSPTKAKAPKRAVAKPAPNAVKRAPKPAAIEPAPSSSETTVFRNASDVKILIVDDEPEMLELLAPFFRQLGYTVFEAGDGDLGLQTILEEHPNIVFLDVNMPTIDGWQIAKYVRDRPYLRQVRIIMASGIGENLNAATAPLFRADAFLDKPFRLDEAEQAVKNLIAKIEAGAL